MFLVYLSASLIVFLVLFLFNKLAADASSTTCQAYGALMHLSLLIVFYLTAVAGVNLYQSLVLAERNVANAVKCSVAVGESRLL